MKHRKTAIAFLIAFLAFTFSCAPLETAKAVDETFLSTSGDGYISYLAVDDYNTAWTATTGQNLSTSENYLVIGQTYVEEQSWAEYTIMRTYLLFDTSTIPDGSGLNDVQLSLYVYSDNSDTDFNITVQNGQSTYPHNPLQLSDYNKAAYSGSGGTLNTSGLTPGNRYNITITETDWITQTGYTKLCLRSTLDIAGTAPTGDEYITLYSGNSYGAPILYITYGQTTFTFIGLLNEDTGLMLSESERAVNVTAYYSGDISSEIFTVNGTEIFSTDYVPLYFKFDTGSTDREWWVTSGDVNSTIYIFNATLTAYTIQFSDLIGKLDLYPYVEVKRNINGSDVTVEKRKVDINDKIYCSVIYGQTYTVSISDGTDTISFGSVLFENDASVDLTIRGLEFPDNIQVGYRYVRVYVTRSADNDITLNYEDDLSETTSVVFDIYYQDNSTLAYGNSVSTSSSWIDTWSDSDANTEYFCVVTINHATFGVMDYRQVLPRLYDDALPFGLNFLGTLPFNTAYLIPSFILLCCSAGFSALNSYLGLGVTVALAVIFAWLNWLPIAVDLLVFVFALVIVFALVAIKRRTVVY